MLLILLVVVALIAGFSFGVPMLGMWYTTTQFINHAPAILREATGGREVKNIFVMLPQEVGFHEAIRTEA